MDKKLTNMYKAIYYTHVVSVTLFLVIYLVKTGLLLVDKKEILNKVFRTVRVPEMIISLLFLITGIYMLTQIPVINSLLIIKIVAVFAAIPMAIIGFRKRNKALALIAFLLIVAAYGLAEMSKKRNAMATNQSTNASTGQDIFNANCISCHGSDGKLGLQGAPDLTTSEKNITEKIEIIKNGKGVMSGFNDRLTDEQIQAVAEYTETLK
jgi:mono/diheme cytochrome c family protein